MHRQSTLRTVWRLFDTGLRQRRLARIWRNIDGIKPGAAGDTSTGKRNWEKLTAQFTGNGTARPIPPLTDVMLIDHAPQGWHVDIGTLAARLVRATLAGDPEYAVRASRARQGNIC